MLREQFDQQNVANSIEHRKWKVWMQTCCKYHGNGSFQLQNAANSKENEQNRKSKRTKTEKKQNKRNQWTRMQPHRTLLWNKSFQQSCTCFPCSHTSVDCGVWNGVECRVWSVKIVKTVECWVGNATCRVWSGDCKVWNVKCKVHSVKCKVSGVECKV